MTINDEVDLNILSMTISFDPVKDYMVFKTRYHVAYTQGRITGTEFIKQLDLTQGNIIYEME